MKRDLLSAYLATASRVAAFLIVAGLVYRLFGAATFATLVLIRAVAGILGVLAMGMAQQTVRLGAQADAADDKESLRRLYCNALAVSLHMGILALAAGTALAAVFHRAFAVPPQANTFVRLVMLMFALGTAARVASDASGGVLQATGRMFLDNLLQGAAEWLWPTVSVLGFWVMGWGWESAGYGAAISGAALLLARWWAAETVTRVGWPLASMLEWDQARSLLAGGGVIALGQLADFLYAPLNHIVINRVVGPSAVAAYAPAAQVDALLLLGVSGIVAAALPHASAALARGRIDQVRRIFDRSVLASLLLLCGGAAAAYLAAPIAFGLWLGDPMRESLAILPLVLVHSIIGGSTAAGRSILIAAGHARAFTASVLIAAFANVALGVLLAGPLGLGLRGVVIATVAVVTARCWLWLPWYVQRILREAPAGGSDGHGHP